MGRCSRNYAESGVYHIVLRGINRQTIFYDDADRETFLNRVKLKKEQLGFNIYAFCLMGNHIHLLIREKDVSISKIMQDILSSYTFWYNRKYERMGNLFQDRFKSEPVDSDAYLLCAARYIHRNPIKAGLVANVFDYHWSSYSAYVKDIESFIDKTFILDTIGGIDEFIEFTNSDEQNNFIDINEIARMSDEKLSAKIIDALHLSNINELRLIDKAQLKKSIEEITKINGCSIHQLARVTGLSEWVIRHI